jgi:hypothetical protein
MQVKVGIVAEVGVNNNAISKLRFDVFANGFSVMNNLQNRKTKVQMYFQCGTSKKMTTLIWQDVKNPGNTLYIYHSILLCISDEVYPSSYPPHPNPSQKALLTNNNLTTWFTPYTQRARYIPKIDCIGEYATKSDSSSTGFPNPGIGDKSMSLYRFIHIREAIVSI